MSNNPKEHKPTWLVLAPGMFLFIWSMGYIAARTGLYYAEPMTLLTLRFACVVALMVVLFVIMRPPLPKSWAEVGHLAIVGFLLQAVYFGMCWIAFIEGMAVGTLALLLSFQPIIVGLIAPRWSGEKISWRQWVGLVLGLVGAIIVIVTRSEIETSSLLSFLCAFGALFGITLGSLWEKRFGVSHHPVTANLIGFTAGLIAVFPLMLAYDDIHIEWTGSFVAALLFLIFGVSLIGTGLLLAMIRVGDVSRVSALFYLVPPFVALFAWLMLGEVMPPVAWIGIAIASGGVFLATR